MRRGFLGSIASLAVSAGLSLAQSPPPSLPAALVPETKVVASEPAKTTTEGVPQVMGGSSPYWPHQGGSGNDGRTASPYTGGYIASMETPIASGLGGPYVDPNPLTYYWVGVEYLLWWAKDAPQNVPLVTGGTPASQGILGRPGTAVVFGGSGLDYGLAQGGRTNFGVWRDEQHTLGLEGTFFMLEQRAINFKTLSDAIGSQVVAQPFFDVLTGTETSTLSAFPGAFAGGAWANANSRLWGAEVNARSNFLREEGLNVDLFFGFRYTELEENLDLGSVSQLLPTNTIPGLPGGIAGFNGTVVTAPSTLAVSDNFAVRNQFYGGQIGAQIEAQRGRMFVNVKAKVAIGGVHQIVMINGGSTLNNATSVPGGLFAVSTNSGRYLDDRFAIIPEGTINFGYQVNPYLRAFVGYNYMYWNDVVRSGDLIDRNINRTQVPTSLVFGPLAGPAQPVVRIPTHDYWAQGINFGCELSF